MTSFARTSNESSCRDRVAEGYTNPSTPTTLQTVNPDGIPAELQTLRQWVTWRGTWNAETERWNKVLTNPRTGRNASSTNPKTWATFAEALTAWQSGKGAGIGFVFTESDSFFGIDIDHCRNPETGEVDSRAWSIVARLDSYTEPSVSGTGLHLIARGTKPDGCKNRIDGCEIYDTARFFCFTGMPLAGHDAIHERTEALARWHRETAKPKPAPRSTTTTTCVNADDSKIVERVRRTAKGARLLAGDWNGYISASEGDMALANLFASAGVIDPEQGARLLAAHALVAEDKAARVDYIDRTVGKALADVSPWDGWDTPPVRLTAHAGPKPQDADMVSEELANDVAGLKAIIIDLRSRVIAAEARAEAAEARADKLSDLQSKTTSIIRNSKLGQERFTAVALAYQLGNRESSGDEGDNGLHRMPLARIAEAAGVSEDTASKHLKKLADANVIRRKVDWVPEKIDRSTGEITPGHKALFVGTVTNVTDFVDAVARLEPDIPKTWGGRLDRCEPCREHPNAGMIKRTTWHCADCDTVLFIEPDAYIGPKPQDADMVGELAATGTDGPPPRNYHGSVAVLGSVSDTASHNHIDITNTGSIANSWLHARPITPPVDMGVPF